MVAITVILAAVIAAFVLDMGSGQSANAQAGIQYEEGATDGEVTITVTAVERADGLTIDADDCGALGGGAGGTTSLEANAGASKTVTCGSSGTIQVLGEYDGSESVISTYDYDDS